MLPRFWGLRLRSTNESWCGLLISFRALYCACTLVYPGPPVPDFLLLPRLHNVTEWAFRASSSHLTACERLLGVRSQAHVGFSLDKSEGLRALAPHPQCRLRERKKGMLTVTCLFLL